MPGKSRLRDLHRVIFIIDNHPGDPWTLFLDAVEPCDLAVVRLAAASFVFEALLRGVFLL